MSNPLGYVAPVCVEELVDEVRVADVRLPRNARAAITWLVPGSRFIRKKARSIALLETSSELFEKPHTRTASPG